MCIIKKSKITIKSYNIEVCFFYFPWTKFDNVYKKIDNALGMSKTCVDSATRFFKILINEKNVTPVDNFPYHLFIKRNNLNPMEIISSHLEYGGLGGGDFINDKLKIEIRSNEVIHNKRPHIHISNCKGKNGVSFSLWDNPVILSGEKNWDKFFSSKEKKLVMKMLNDNKDKFANYYLTLSQGIVPSSFTYIYDNEEFVFSCENSTR